MLARNLIRRRGVGAVMEGKGRGAMARPMRRVGKRERVTRMGGGGTSMAVTNTGGDGEGAGGAGGDGIGARWGCSACCLLELCIL